MRDLHGPLQERPYWRQRLSGGKVLSEASKRTAILGMTPPQIVYRILTPNIEVKKFRNDHE